MGFLDLFDKSESISMRPQPNEGTHLPGPFELHREEIVIGVAIVVAVALLIGLFRYRANLRNSLIDFLAAVVRLRRKTVTKARSFWSEVEDRADHSSL
jgi:hypothetical protein